MRERERERERREREKERSLRGAVANALDCIASKFKL